MKRFFFPLSLLLSLSAQPALAEVPLLGGSALVAALKGSPPCCVIDGRKAVNRSISPLPGALPYQPDRPLNPTATIVVLADSDDQALQIARVLEQQYPGKPVVAVKGGLKGWQAVAAAPVNTPQADGAPSASQQFVIPLNTCENGEPLQTLQSSQK